MTTTNDLYSYETGERYQRGRDTLSGMNNDPDGLSSWRGIDDAQVGADVDRLLGEFCFGDVWAGDGLDKRTRRVITLTSLATQYRPIQLSGHIKSALEQGFSRKEVLEIFRHLIPYTGFPSVLSAIEVAQQVFAELDGQEG